MLAPVCFGTWGFDGCFYAFVILCFEISGAKTNQSNGQYSLFQSPSAPAAHAHQNMHNDRSDHQASPNNTSDPADPLAITHRQACWWAPTRDVVAERRANFRTWSHIQHVEHSAWDSDCTMQNSGLWTKPSEPHLTAIRHHHDPSKPHHPQSQHHRQPSKRHQNTITNTIKTPSKHHQNIITTPRTRHQHSISTPSKHHQNTIKTSSKHHHKMVACRCSSTHHQNTIKTPSKHHQNPINLSHIQPESTTSPTRCSYLELKAINTSSAYVDTCPNVIETLRAPGEQAEHVIAPPDAKQVVWSTQTVAKP